MLSEEILLECAFQILTRAANQLSRLFLRWLDNCFSKYWCPEPDLKVFFVAYRLTYSDILHSKLTQAAIGFLLT